MRVFEHWGVSAKTMKLQGISKVSQKLKKKNKKNFYLTDDLDKIY
jgi:hypothetical protein